MREVLYAAAIVIATGISARADGDVARAGYPNEVSRFARPADDGRSIGYLVGGGALNWRKASPPGPNDGTWGWDYSGGLFRRRVDLGWWHGRRYQGGSGAYKTDGPKLPE
jgi:hypothetical protein